jgi:predicted transcriptional regulator
MDIDIQNLVTSLRADGMTQTEIAAELGCSQSAVSDMSKGKIGRARPSHRIVDGLMRLVKRRKLASARRPANKPKKNE